MTSVKTLRAAAALLREQESKATSPEWWTPQTVTGPSGTWFDAEWIAMVSPALAIPLAEWLESTAERFEGAQSHWEGAGRAGEMEQVAIYAGALDVARVLLGEQAEEEES